MQKHRALLRKEKEQRVYNANRVLEAISKHGLRYFYHPSSDRLASFSLNDQGQIWYHDEQTGASVYVHNKRQWRGFSHGGGLRRLIEALRDYIATGMPISADWFGTHIMRDDGSNYWGYAPEALAAVQDEVAKLAAVASSEEEPLAA